MFKRSINVAPPLVSLGYTLLQPVNQRGPGVQALTPSQPAWKKYARIILPHIGLIMLSLLYVIGGAFVFYHIEEPNELAVRAESLKMIEQQKQRMMDHLWEVVNNDSISERKIICDIHSVRGCRRGGKHRTGACGPHFETTVRCLRHSICY